MNADVSLYRAFCGCRASVTGGLDFIGSTVARRLVALGARVTTLDALIPEYGGNRRDLSGFARDARIRDAVERTVQFFRAELSRYLSSTMAVMRRGRGR